jgi:hypothetical protein
MEPNDRTNQRAEDGPAEEQAAGSEDRVAQAAAVLADSEERQAAREESGDTVEHRTPTGDR